jgi:hypothetical protein
LNLFRRANLLVNRKAAAPAHNRKPPSHSRA